MKRINFYRNHNNKLGNLFFTTIRPDWDYYAIGEKYECFLGGVFQFNSQIIDIKKFYLKDVNNYMSYIDAGVDVEALKKMMKTMYKQKDLEKGMLLFILIQKL